MQFFLNKHFSVHSNISGYSHCRPWQDLCSTPTFVNIFTRSLFVKTTPLSDVLILRGEYNVGNIVTPARHIYLRNQNWSDMQRARSWSRQSQYVDKLEALRYGKVILLCYLIPNERVNLMLCCSSSPLSLWRKEIKDWSMQHSGVCWL